MPSTPKRRKAAPKAIASPEEVLEALTRIIRQEEQDLDEKPNLTAVNRAAELLGKYHTLFTDRTKAEEAVPVTIVDDVPKELEPEKKPGATQARKPAGKPGPKPLGKPVGRSMEKPGGKP